MFLRKGVMEIIVSSRPRKLVPVWHIPSHLTDRVFSVGAPRPFKWLLDLKLAHSNASLKTSESFGSVSHFGNSCGIRRRFYSRMKPENISFLTVRRAYEGGWPILSQSIKYNSQQDGEQSFDE